MKFAGPSMGAALGSGLMGGMANAQELMTKEELARDTSAMATYAKLVQSGEWEPVGESGVTDGGVLRVGNVGFLKKVPKIGIDLKAQNYLSLIESRKKATNLAREKFEFDKNKPVGMMSVENPVTGERIEVDKNAAIPQGFYKIGVVNAPLMEARVKNNETGLLVSDLNSRISDKNAELSKLSKLELLPPAKEGVVKAGQDKARVLRNEIKELEAQRVRIINNRNVGRVGDFTPPVEGYTDESNNPTENSSEYVKPKGKMPPPSIIPPDVWRRIAKENGFRTELGDEASKLVKENKVIDRLLSFGVLKIKELFDLMLGEEKKESVDKYKPLNSNMIKRYKIKKPDFIESK